MRRSAATALLFALLLAIPSFAAAAPLKAYVAQFAVTPDNAGLKSALQTLLSSRLASESVAPVAQPGEADVVVSGSYTQFGKVFSLDASAKDQAGKVVASVFEQGESLDDLIPALTKVSARLKAELARHQAASPAAAQVPAAAAPQAAQPAKSGWISQRLAGAQVAMAPGATGPQGRELFVADGHALRVYRQEKTLKLLDEVKFGAREKVIAADSLVDAGGAARVFVTMLQGESLVSRIYSFEKDKLTQVAGPLPYFFRAIAFGGGAPKLYAQQIGNAEDYYGDLYEAVEKDGKVELANPIKMPRYGNVYNYNRISGPDGASYATVFSPDGYLIVYSEAGDEIWRSTEKFGGSETYFQRETQASAREPEERIRWRFLDQRITTTRDSSILVPQNDGFFVLGNNRSYSKHTLVRLSWNGSSLEETWRSNKNQNYLADYYLDAQAGEIVSLEVVQKEGVFSQGGSAVRTVALR